MRLPQESKVIELKYAAKTFAKMNETERELAAYQLLIKIHAIRGWTIPASELMDILVSEFQKKLSESYANVNEEEMMYAFRNCEMDIKDWGKALNLSLIDEVMIPYLENRLELSKYEENLKRPVMLEEKTELTDEDKAQWMMDWKIDPNINIELIPLIFYDFIKEKKLIKVSQEKRDEYLDRAAQAIKTKLFDDTNVFNKTNDAYVAYNKFVNMEKDGFTGEFKGRILNRAKRLIVFDYLKDRL